MKRDVVVVYHEARKEHRVAQKSFGSSQRSP